MKADDKLYIVEFVLPLKVDSKLSLNSIYSSSHWTKRKRQSEQIHNLVKLSLFSQGIPKILFKYPAKIEFWWNSKLDLDNHGYLAKLIIDGLKGYFLKDDTKKYINSISHNYWSENGIKIRLTEQSESENQNEHK